MSDTESESSEDEVYHGQMSGAGDDPYVTYISASKNPMSKKDIINKEESEPSQLSESESSYLSDSESDISYNRRRRTRRRRYDDSDSDESQNAGKWSYDSAPAKTRWTY